MDYLSAKRYAPIMPITHAPEPGDLARATSAEIRAEMARQRLTGQQLATKIGRSQNYVAKRLRDETPLTLDDVEAIARALSVSYSSLISAAARKVRDS